MLSRIFVSSVGGFCLFLAGCAPPTPTTQQYFNDAKKNLASMDYDAALTNLDRLTKAAGNEPLGQQAAVLRTALLLALANGTREMADAYGTGMKESPAERRRSQFLRMRADYYSIARVRFMNAMEAAMAQRGKLGQQGLPLEVPFPDFAGTPHGAVARIKGGYWVEDPDRYRAELEAVRNSLALVLAQLAGAGGDPHKGKAAFEKGGLQIDPRVYLLEMSDNFLRLSEIFERKALDDPRYHRTSLEITRDTLDVALKLLEAKPDKDLQERAKKTRVDCEKRLKALGP